jgi:trigger factor
MTIQVQEVDYCKVNVAYVADSKAVNSKRQEILSKYIEMAKTQPIKGYRPGRAPVQAIKVYYGKQIDSQIKQDLVSVAYDEVLYETKMKPVFYPQVLRSELNKDQFECELAFFKKPEFELKEYKNFEVPQPHQTQTHMEKVEAHLESLRRDYADVVPYSDDDFVEMGDQITMDVTYTHSTEPLSKLNQILSAEGALYKVGGGQRESEFDDEILGMKAGEERSFTIKKSSTDLFDVKVMVHMGTKSIPCALDDEFAQKLDCPTLKDLIDRVGGIATQQIEQEIKQKFQQQIVARLLSNHNFEVPQFLIDMEAQMLAAQYQMKFNNLDAENKKIFLDMAKSQVKLSLILDSIREQEPEAVFTEQEIIDHLSTQLMEAGQNPKKILGDLERNGKLAGVVAKMRNESTLDWLMKTCKITVEE